jgi:hypothetical protein
MGHGHSFQFANATNYQRVTVVYIMDYIMDLSQLMDYSNYLCKLRDILYLW